MISLLSLLVVISYMGYVSFLNIYIATVCICATLYRFHFLLSLYVRT
jgi:hypothetical protein